MDKVTVITATTGNPRLRDNILSVANQTHTNIQHLVVVDGLERKQLVDDIMDALVFPIMDMEKPPSAKIEILQLPYATGKDRYNGHRIYGGCTYFADGDYVIYLDDDNTIEPTHVADCLRTLQFSELDWTYSFRKIQDFTGTFLCKDDCESLGKWPSILHPEDYFIDVNCYFMKKMLAVYITPIWYRKFREPGQIEIDRAICQTLREIAPKYDSTYNYTVGYTVGNTGLSVNADFFLRGNEEMLRRYNGKLPWVK